MQYSLEFHAFPALSCGWDPIFIAAGDLQRDIAKTD
jgi:hypothetical protein